MWTDIGHALMKRSSEPAGGDGVAIPAWAFLVLVANVLVFLPLVVYLDYTLQGIYPVLAIVEDEAPPSYEPISLNSGSVDEETTARSRSMGSKPGDSSSVTSSLRGINRLLKATGGWRANFRGYFCHVAQDLMALGLLGFFYSILGDMFAPLAMLLASLVLVQYSTAWVHIVISAPSPLPFWQRLPDFKRTFDATWKPVSLYWLATQASRWLPWYFGKMIGLKLPSMQPSDNAAIPVSDGNLWKFGAAMFFALLCTIFITIPARVVLTRVQASLLPEGEDPIVFLDRSFRGSVAPAVVGGKGYVGIRDAWSTFSKAAWRRLVILYAKVYLISFAGGLLLAAVFVPQWALIFSSL